MRIRKVEPRDVEVVLELIKGLVEYEREPLAVINTVEKLHRDLFVEKYAEGLIAEDKNEIVGFAVYYTSYSTWKGPCLYLEDLYVVPEKRKLGAGSILFDEIVSIAKERCVARMDWQVLDWNEPAIEFYKRKNAEIEPGWLNGRMYFPENG